MLVRLGSPRVLARRAVLGSRRRLGRRGGPARHGRGRRADHSVHLRDPLRQRRRRRRRVRRGASSRPAPPPRAGRSSSTTATAGAVYDADRAASRCRSVTGPAVAVDRLPGERPASRTARPTASRWSARTARVAEFLSYEGAFTAVGGPANGMTSTDIGVSRGRQRGGRASRCRARYNTETEALQWFSPARRQQGRGEPDLHARAAAAGNPCDADADPRDRRGPGRRAPRPRSPASRSPSAASSSATSPASAASTCRTPTATATPPPPTASSSFSPASRSTSVTPSPSTGARARELRRQTQITSRDGRRGLRRRHRGRPARADAARPAGRRRRRASRSRACSSTPVDTLTVSEVFDLTSFGELTLSEGGLLVQPTELARPGTPEAAGDRGGEHAAPDRPRRRRRTPAVSATNRPVPVADHPGARRRRARLHRARSCSATASASGGCSRPTAPPTAPSRRRTPARPRPDEVGGDVQIGAFNVLNYFITLTGPDARGAHEPGGVRAAGGQDRAGDRGARTPTS